MRNNSDLKMTGTLQVVGQETEGNAGWRNRQRCVTIATWRGEVLGGFNAEKLRETKIG